jgi:hypothetical protein
MLGALHEWVEASATIATRLEPSPIRPPPAEMIILVISHGAAFLRWLAGLDEPA